MTVNTTTNKAIVQGNGSTTIFNFSFVYVAASFMSVTYTDADGNDTLLDPSTYLLTLNAISSGIWGIGGTVTYPLSGSPIATGTKLTIVRTLPEIQDITISNQGSFYPQVVESMGDIITMLTQQIAGEIGRAIQIPITDNTGLLTTLPGADQRALQALVFDADGNVAVGSPADATVSSAMQPVVAAATVQAGQIALGIRESLIATRNYYVATTGSDSNNGLTVGTPWLTIQHAVDWVCDNLDLRNTRVKINVAAGTYNESVAMRGYSGSFNPNANPITSGEPGALFTVPIISGDPLNPTGVIVNGGSSSCFIGVNCSVPWMFQFMRLNAVGGSCLLADWWTTFYYGGITFGAASVQIFAQRGSHIETIGGMPCTIVAGATTHATATYQSEVILQGTITLTGTPAFTYFAQATNFGIISNGATYVGSATGSRYNEAGGFVTNGDGCPGNALGLLQSFNRVYNPANYYVATTGNDANPGTLASPFLTLQGAWDWIAQNVDAKSGNIVINLAAGSYAGFTANGMPVQAASITILGDIAAPASYIINSAITAQGGAQFFLKGIKGTSASNFLLVREFSKVGILQGCQFGAITNSCFNAQGGTIEIFSDYIINGSQQYHYFASARGLIKNQGLTITISGTPAFTVFAKAQNQAGVFIQSNTYSGSATGKRFEVNTQAQVDTNTAAAANTLPGNAVGSADAVTFSVYI